MRLIIIVCGAALLAGCASLDPTADVERASSLVETRAESATGWDAPWHERAEHWDGATPLSSTAAVRVALQNNRAIRREVEAIAASRADYVQAHLLPNPVINFAYGFPTDGGGGAPLMATLLQQVTWLWLRPARIDAATAELQARVLAVSEAALDLVAAVRRAHAEVVYAERAAALQRENIELIRRSLTLLEDRFTVGEASRLDVNRVELDLLRAKTNLSDREATLAEAKRAMLLLLARADEAADWHSDDGVPSPADAVAELDEADVVALASTQRLEVAAAVAVRDAHAARLELAELGQLPDVGAGVSYQKNFSNRPGVFPAVQVTPKLLDDNGARVAKAAAQLRQAEIEADRARQDAVAETRRAWVALGAELVAVRAYEQEILALAEQNLDLADRSFDVGEIDLTVLLEAQRQVTAARLELTARQRAATDQLIELERAAGGMLSTAPPLPETLASKGGAP